jgi:hypothetical protein
MARLTFETAATAEWVAALPFTMWSDNALRPSPNSQSLKARLGCRILGAKLGQAKGLIIGGAHGTILTHHGSMSTCGSFGRRIQVT